MGPKMKRLAERVASLLIDLAHEALKRGVNETANLAHQKIQQQKQKIKTKLTRWAKKR
jgi:hypothetical protein